MTENLVSALNIPATIRRIFYKVGHTRSCEYAAKEHDRLMAGGWECMHGPVLLDGNFVTDYIKHESVEIMPSKDYKKLFQFIVDGNTAVAYVDYDYRDGEVARDICKVERRGEFFINIGVRGMAYGNVFEFQREEGTEEELFIKECEGLNLEWVGG